jgi:hypothetical protein
MATYQFGGNMPTNGKPNYVGIRAALSLTMTWQRYANGAM